jgi:PAS domain S-box-containing protein
MNPVAQTLTGWNREEAIGRPVKEVFHIINGKTGKRVEDPVTKVIREGRVVGLGNHSALIARDGTEISIEESGAPIRDEKGEITGVVLDFRDIRERKQTEEALQKAHDELEQRVEERTAELTAANEQLKLEIEERKRSEKALRESEEKYRELFSTVSDAIMVFDGETNQFVDVNDACLRLYGHSKEDFLKLRHTDITMEPEKSRESIRQALSGELKRIPLCYHKKKDGTIFPVEISTGAIKLENRWMVCGVVRDITERKHAEEQIKASLREKEVLLKEIHHRVKNNMQVISTLLMLQAANIKDKQYADMFKESQVRIRSMALVHEKLYRSEDFANVDFNGYIKSLLNFLFRSYGVDTNKIALKLEVEDVSLGLDTAIPCGLVINELVSNSIKYAFPEDRKGEIRITFRSINEDDLELTVSDDGIGIPEDLDIRNTKSLGLDLVTILAEDQLDGKIELDRTEGTKYYILLKRQMYKERT